MTLDTSVTFRSGRFRPVLPPEKQVNPGIHGAELAWWLCERLAEAGVATSYPGPEDWGWYLERETESGGVILVCCANVDGTEDQWHCFLEPRKRGLLGRSGPPEGEVRALVEALALVLEREPSIEDVEWGRL